MIDKMTVNGWTVEIHHDDDPLSPRDDMDHGCELVYAHRNYTFPNDAGISFDDFAGWAEVETYLREEEGALMVVPVYMIDHSGLAFRAGRSFADCDPGEWDSGVIGLAYVTPKNWADTQGEAHPWTGSDEDREQARKLIEADVTLYGQYVEGDVYGYVIKDFDGEPVDGCWGFYGYGDIEDEARAAAENMEHTPKCTGTLNRLAGEIGHNRPCPLHPQFVVSDTETVDGEGLTPVLGRFRTEAEAAEFIGTLPDHDSGRYALDAPTIEAS